MSTAKVAITLDKSLLCQLDRLVSTRVYPSRSRAIQEAVADQLQKFDRNRLARECAKLDPAFEQAMAEEGMGAEANEWPEY